VIGAHLSGDALLEKQILLFPGLRVPGAFDDFELAIRAILGQQVSVAGASTVAGRLVQNFGEIIDTPFAEINRHFPTPENWSACLWRISARLVFLKLVRVQYKISHVLRWKVVLK